MSDQNLAQQPYRYKRSGTAMSQTEQNSSIHQYEKGPRNLFSNTEKRMTSAKVIKRKDGALRNNGVKTWMENNEIQNQNLIQNVAVKSSTNFESKKPSRNLRQKHQTHIIDKIDKNIEFQMRQKTTKNSDLIQIADNQVNTFLMNNQKSEHRRLMSANPRSKSAALIPKNRGQSVNQKLLALNEAELQLCNPVFDETKYRVPGKSKNSRKKEKRANASKEQLYQHEVKLSKIYSNQFNESLHSSNNLSKTVLYQKQNQGHIRQSSRNYLSSLSQNQAGEATVPIIEKPRRHDGFNINLVDLEPKQYLSSTHKMQQSFLLNQNVSHTPSIQGLGSFQQTPINNGYQPSQIQPSQFNQFGRTNTANNTAKHGEVFSPVDMIQSQNAYPAFSPPFESQIDVSNVTQQFRLSRPELQERVVTPLTQQERQRATETTLDSDDFQMLMMLKTKLKKVRKKEDNQKIQNKMTSVKNYLNDFQIDMPQENKINEIEQIDNEIEKLKNVKKLHLAQRSSSITGPILNNEEMMIKKSKGQHSRAQTSLLNHLDDSSKSQNGIRKTIEIQKSENSYNNSEQVETKNTPQIKFIKTKKIERKKYHFLEDQSQKSHKTEPKRADVKILKKQVMSQDVQTEDNYVQKKEDLRTQEILQQELDKVKEQKSDIENKNKIQIKQNMDVQQELIKKLIQKEVQTVVSAQQRIASAQKGRNRRLSIQSIDMQQIEILTQINGAKRNQSNKSITQYEQSYKTENQDYQTQKKDDPSYQEAKVPNYNYSSIFDGSVPSKGKAKSRPKNVGKPPLRQISTDSNQIYVSNENPSIESNQNLQVGSSLKQSNQRSILANNSEIRQTSKSYSSGKPQSRTMNKQDQNSYGKQVFSRQDNISEFTEGQSMRYPSGMALPQQNQTFQEEPSIRKFQMGNSLSSTPNNECQSPIIEKFNRNDQQIQQSSEIIERQQSGFVVNQSGDEERQQYYPYSGIGTEENDLGVYEDNSESSRYAEMIETEEQDQDDYENFEASDQDYSYDSEDESAPTTSANTVKENFQKKRQGSNDIKVLDSKFESMINQFDQSTKQEFTESSKSFIEFDNLKSTFDSPMDMLGFEGIEVPIMEKQPKIDLNSEYNKLVYEIDLNTSKNIDKTAFELNQNVKQLNKTLTDLQRQQERMQLNKRIKPLEMSAIPGKNLITIRDINLNLIKESQLELKMERNKELVYEDDNDVKFSIENRVKNIGYFKLKDHYNRNIGDMLFMSEQQFKLGEQNLVLPKILHWFKHQVQNKVNEQFLNSLTKQQYRKQQATYFLCVNNYAQFDQLDKDINLFDTMQQVNQYKGVYNVIDWQIVQDEVERVESKVVSKRFANPDINRQTTDIDVILNQYMDIKDAEFEDMKITIPDDTMEILSDNNRASNLMMINFKMKLNVIAKKYFTYIKNYSFNMRYFHDLEYMNLKKCDDVQSYRKPVPPIVKGILDEPKSWNSSRTYIYTSMKHQKIMSSFIFSKNYTSIFTGLKQFDWDVYAKQSIEIVHNIWIKKDIRFKEKLQSQKQVAGKKLIYQKKVRRSQSSAAIMSRLQEINHSKINYMIWKYDEADYKVDCQSVGLPIGDEKVQMVRPFRNYGAITQFTIKQNEANVIKKMAPMVEKVKDSQFLAYKKLEYYPYLWFDEEDQQGKIIQHYGYKSQFIRDPKNTDFQMEVYVPILTVKGEKKLQRNNKNFKKMKYNLGNNLRRKFLRHNEVFDPLIIKSREPLDKKVINAIQAQGYDTDESMKGIELSDIISEDSDNEGNEDDKTKMEAKMNNPGYAKYMQCLEKSKHPLEKYAEVTKAAGKVNGETSKKPHFSTPKSQISDRISQMTQVIQKDVDCLDVDQLRELNEQNDNYRSKKDRYKIDTIIKKNNIQIQNDFIKQIVQEQTKHAHQKQLKLRVNERLEDGTENILGTFQKQQIIKTNKMIDKLKFNLGLGGKIYLSDQQDHKSMNYLKTESEDVDGEIYDLEEEEQLIVEREIMMSLLGKFIDNNENFQSDSASIELDQTNDVVITESQLDEEAENQGMTKSSIRKESSLRKTEFSQLDMESLKAPSQQSPLVKTETKDWGKEPDPEVNDEDCISDCPDGQTHLLNKLQGFLDKNDFDDVSQLESISSDQLFEIQDKKTQDEEGKVIEFIKKKKNNKGKIVPHRHQYLQALLTKKMDDHGGVSNAHVNDAFKQKNDLMINQFKHLVETPNTTQRSTQMTQENVIMVQQLKIKDLIVASLQNQITDNVLFKKKILQSVNEGKHKVVEDLIQNCKTSINFKMRDEHGNSLAAIATCRGDLAMLKILIKNHFDINIPNNDGNTPLHFGISLKQLKCVEQLLFAYCHEDTINSLGLNCWQCS